MNKKSLRLWSVLLNSFIALMMLYGNQAAAECNLSFSGLTANQTIEVNAASINTTTVSKTINFNVDNSGSLDCYYFITIDEGVSGDINYNRWAKITHALPALFQRANNDAISYQLYSQTIIPSNIVKTLNHAVFDQNVLGPFQIRAGQTVSESFLINVPTQSLPNLIAESYQDDVTLTLYKNPNASIDLINDCPTCTEESRQPLNLQFRLTDYVTLSIGDTYDPYSRQGLLDFGELETSQQQSFSVYVGGRTGSGNACSVTISSLNGSKLVRDDVFGTQQSHDEISYTVTAQPGLGGAIVPATIDLSAPNTAVKLATASQSLICGNNSSGVMAVDVSVTIGSVDNKVSGTYRDTITVVATIGL